MSVEVERTRLLQKAPWSKFTSTHVTEFVKLGLLTEARKEHQRGIIAWEPDENIVRLGILSEYYQKPFLYQYGYGLFALILGVKGFPPIRYTPELQERVLTVLKKGHTLLIAESQKMLPFFYDASNEDSESEDSIDEETWDVMMHKFGFAMPLVMQLLDGSPEWSQYATMLPSDPDRASENKDRIRPSMLNHFSSLVKSLAGNNLATLLGNPTSRLSANQKEVLLTEGFMSMKANLSWDDFFNHVESYSEDKWNTFFTYLTMIRGSMSFFAPKRMPSDALIPMLTVSAYFADSFQQYDRQLMDLFTPVTEQALRIRENEINRWLKPWRSADHTEPEPSTNTETSMDIEEVQ